MEFTVDYKAMERSLDDIARKALPKATAGFLNGIAFEARKQLIAHTKDAFDGHVKFTERAWVVDRARPDKGADMYAVVKAQPAQAEYLRFQIFGGTRKTGDAGSGPQDLFVYGKNKNRAGNIRWGYVKKLSQQNREEKAKRSSLRGQRKALRDAGQDASHLQWFRVNRNKPGIFFGEIGGTKGYWQRPKRSKASRKRQIGVISVRSTSKPTPLLSVADQARYKPRYEYDKQIQKSLRSHGSQAAFGRELQRAMRPRRP